MTLCDAHIHVVGDPARYPMLPSRTYTPPPATVAQVQRLGAPHGITRFVVVQPSFYGTDNTLLVEGLQALGRQGAGVAVLDPATATDAELQRLAAAGVRGLRINLYSTHGAAARPLAERFGAIAALAGRIGWHVQVIADLPILIAAADLLAEAAVPVVIDHYGLPGGRAPDSAEGARLLALVAKPHIWVKLSAPYRSSYDPLATRPDPIWMAELLKAAPDRCVWGSDWPHTPAHETQPGGAGPMPYRPIDYGALVAAFRAAVADDRAAQLVMGANPARLYGFVS